MFELNGVTFQAFADAAGAATAHARQRGPVTIRHANGVVLAAFTAQPDGTVSIEPACRYGVLLVEELA